MLSEAKSAVARIGGGGKKSAIVFLAVFFVSLPALSSASTLEQGAGLTPDSSFYFLETFKERVVLFFTFKTESKAKLHLKYAEERLAELEKMVSENKHQYSEKLVKKYQTNMESAQKKMSQLEERGKDITELSEKLKESSLRQQNVLQRVLTQVPEEAQKAIQRAIGVSQKGLEKALESIQKKGLEQQIRPKKEK